MCVRAWTRVTCWSLPNLLAALDHREVAREDVDFVFLTHIHLDHAGGAGALLRHLPNAQVVLHPRGAPHLIDPARLIAGTEAVYGKERFAALYGDIVPLPEARVRQVNDGDRVTLGRRTLELIHTPGHALHHYCIVDAAHRGVFTGDTFGVSYRDTDTARGAFIIPTTTPTHFDPVAMHASIDRILSYRPEYVYLTHYSRVGEVAGLAADLHRRLDGFVAIAQRHADSSERVTAIASAMRSYLHAELDEHGYDGDADARDAVLAGDIELNAQGLDVWLARLARAPAAGD